jgi:hypothetical protein
MRAHSRFKLLTSLIVLLCVALSPICEGQVRRGRLRLRSTGGAAATAAAIPSFVNAWAKHGIGGQTLSVSPTVGDTLIAVIGYDRNPGGTAQTISSVKDNNGNSFTLDNGPINIQSNNGQNNTVSYYRLSHIGTVTSVIVILTPDNVNPQCVVAVADVSGLTGSPVDAVDSTGGSEPNLSAWKTGNLVTTNANDILFGFAFAPSTPSLTCTSPYLLAVSDSYPSVLCYEVVSSTGTYNPAGAETTFYTAFSLGASYK